MSIPQIPYSTGINADPKKQADAQAKTAMAVGVGKEQFNKVLDNISGAILGTEEMGKKQRLNKKKQEQVEDGKGMQHEEESVVKQVRKIKKRLKDIAKFERQQLGL